MASLTNSNTITTSAFLVLTLTLTLLHAPPSSAHDSSVEFLRDQCNATLYPDVCYTSLSRYASAISGDPSQLARVAIGVSLAKARRAADYLASLTHHSDFAPDRRAASAVRDCSSTFSDAVSEIRASFKQMRQLGAAGPGPEALRFQLSNVQTWMSAALTNEDTCTDGFDGVQDSDDGGLKSDVCARVVKVSKLTSNALALVNTYASTLH